MEKVKTTVHSELMECPVAFGGRGAKDFCAPHNIDLDKNEMVSLRDRAGRDIFILNTYIGEDEHQVQSQVKYYCYANKQELLEEQTIPLSGRFLAAEFDAYGRLVIILAQKGENPGEYAIFYSQEEYPDSHRFSPAIKLQGIKTPPKAEQIVTSEPEDEVMLHDIIVRKADKSFKLGIKYSSEDSVFFMQCDWGLSAAETIRIGTVNDPWYPSANFCDDSEYGVTLMSITAGQLTKSFYRYGAYYQISYVLTLPPGYTAVGKCQCLNCDYSLVHIVSAQCDALAMLDFSKSGTPNVIVLFECPVSGGGRFRWDAKFEPPPASGAAHCHILIQDRNNVLLHGGIDFSLDRCAYQITSLFPLCKEAFLGRFTSNTDALSFFYYRVKDNSYVSMSFERDERLWKEFPLAMTPELVMAPAYAIEICFMESEHSLPAVNKEVQIWADSRVLVEANNNYQYIDQSRRLNVVTNSNGMINIIQFTDTLDAVPIKVCLLSNMANDEAMEINPAIIIRDKLHGISAEALYDAKEFDSLSGGETYLLQGEYRTMGNAQALADSLAQGVKLARCLAAPYDAAGCRMCGRSGLSNNRIQLGNTTPPAWHLKVDGKKLSFEILTPEAAQDRVKTMYQGADDIELPRWLADIGDVFCAIGNAFVSLAEIVVTGVKAVAKLVIDGVTHVANLIIDTASKAISFVESIFIAVTVEFKKLFKWLGALFNWSDMLNTKAAIYGLLNLIIEKAPDFVELGKNKILEQLKWVDDKVAEVFEQAIATLIPDEGIGAFVKRNTPPDTNGIQDIVSNNILMQRLSGVENVSILSVNELAAWRGEMQSLIDEIKKYVTDIEMRSEYTEAIKFFKDAFTDISSFFTNMLAFLLKALKILCKLVVSTIGTLVTLLFDGVAQTLIMFKNILNKQMDIPFFSAFYRFITGNEMSLLNLFSLLLAVPATIAYKLLNDKAPFADQQEVDEFLVSAGDIFLVKELTEPCAVNSSYRNTKKFRQIISVITGCSGGFFYILCAFDNVSTMITPVRFGELGIKEGVIIISEAISCFGSIPIIYATIGNGEVLADGDLPLFAVSYYEWAAFAYSVFGFLMDYYTTLLVGEWIDRNNNILTVLYGCGHLAITIVCAIGEFDVKSFINDLACTIDELSRISQNSTGCDKWIPVGMDVICGVLQIVFGAINVPNDSLSVSVSVS